MSFEMLKGKPIYLEVVDTGEGYWSDGIYHTGDQVVSNIAVPECLIDPVDKEEVEILPEGISIKDSKWLFTKYKFNTFSESDNNLEIADKVYLSDPNIKTAPDKYVVYDTQQFDIGDDFEMVDAEYCYLIIREGKL